MLTSIASRSTTFDPRLTYNSFIWQKTNGQWSPTTDADGNNTWGWIQEQSSFRDTDLTYKVLRFRCVANDGSNQWMYEYFNFKTSNQTFSLDFRLAEIPDQYPECSDQGPQRSAYGVDSAGFPTGYLLVTSGDGGPMQWPNMASRYGNNNIHPVIFAPGGTQVDLSGSVSDTNGNKVQLISGSPAVWHDSIGRA